MFTNYTVVVSGQKSVLTGLHYANGGHPIELWSKGNNSSIVRIQFLFLEEKTYFYIGLSVFD